MMNQKHRELVEDVFGKVSMSLAESGKIIPLFILILPDQSLLPIIVGNGEEIDLKLYSSGAINAAQEMDADAIIFICEQYMVSKIKGDPDLQPLLDGGIKPSEHPDKEDYLTIIYMEKDGNCESLVSKIKRDLAGTRYAVDFEWLEHSVTNMLTSWSIEITS
jgi:hypothetical protein